MRLRLCLPYLKRQHGVLLIGLVCPALFGQDYDVDAASRQYERAQSVYDRSLAEEALSRERLSQAERVFSDRQQERRALDTRISNLQDEIRTSEQDLTRLERENTLLQNRITQERRDLDRIELSRTQVSNDLERVEHILDRLSAERRELVTQIEDLEKAEKPDEHELRRLKQRRARLQEQIELEKDKKANLVSEKQRLDAACQKSSESIAQAERQFDQNFRRIQQLDSRQKQAQRDLDLARSEVASARDRLERAEERLQVVKDEHNQKILNLDFSRRDRDKARDYYAEVKARYDRALSTAQSDGRSQADRQALREAERRAPAQAQFDGQRDGRVAGGSLGSEDAQMISYSKGYDEGSLAPEASDERGLAYRQGLDEGRLLAQSWAQKTVYPAAYNAELQVYLGRVLDVEAVDLEDGDPTTEKEGASDNLLAPKELASGSVREPSLEVNRIPEQRPLPEPSYSLAVPASDRIDYVFNCRQHPNSHFERVCESEFANQYQTSLRKHYGQSYQANYKPSYAAAGREAYREAREKLNQKSYQTGEKAGALAIGRIHAFTNSKIEAQASAISAAKQAALAFFKSGYLLKFGQVSLIEEYEDQALAPGEKFYLQVQLSNFGMRPTRLGQLRIRVESKNGVEFGGQGVRLLPSLSAEMTTELNHLLAGSVSPLLGQGNFSFDLVLERKGLDGSFVPLQKFSYRGRTKNPLQLTLSENIYAAAIGQDTQLELILKNQTAREFAATQAGLISNPLYLGLSEESASFEVPPLAAGEELRLPVKVRAEAGLTLGQPVALDIRFGEIAGVQNLSQRVEALFKPLRSASLRVCLNGSCLDRVPALRIRSGQATYFSILFNFEASSSRPGPFNYGRGQRSSSLITYADGTHRIGVGEWGPGRQRQPDMLGFVFPPSLKGQRHWIEFDLSEGAEKKLIHSLRIPVEIE